MGEVPGTIVPFPDRRRLPREPPPSAETVRMRRFGLSPPGLILRIPRTLADDLPSQAQACTVLAELAARWQRRLAGSGRALNTSELSRIVVRASRLLANSG